MAEVHAALRLQYQASPGRGVLVAADLAELHGPTSGVVELPLWVFAYPDRQFSLDKPGERGWMYENVLREARRPADLAVLNRDVLVALWPGLNLPEGVRRAWEDQHPALRSAAAAVAAA
jgi:hypothetical protein